MYQGISLEQAPPLKVPFRFFYMGPLFAIIACSVLLTTPGLALQNRWSPEVLSATHLLVLGFGLNIMIGALYQMLPVVAGSPLRYPVKYGALILLSLAVGVVGLSLGFVFQPGWFYLAFIGLGLGVFGFIAHFVEALLRTKSKNETVYAISFSAIGLTVTAVLGLTLVYQHLDQNLYGRPLMTNIHLQWGLLAWILVLVNGVAYQVIPMFFVTSNFSPTTRKSLVPLIFVLLSAHSFLQFIPPPNLWQREISKFGILILASVFAWTTFRRLQTRKRKIPDPTIYYWSLALFSTILSLSIWCANPWFSAQHQISTGLLIGIASILGGFVSLISGMLYKICPFLAWFHMRGLAMESFTRGLTKTTPPHMKTMISPQKVSWNFWCHLLAVLFIFSGVWLGPIVLKFGIGFLGLSFGLLWHSIFTCHKSWLRFNEAIEKEWAATT